MLFVPIENNSKLSTDQIKSNSIEVKKVVSRTLRNVQVSSVSVNEKSGNVIAKFADAKALQEGTAAFDGSAELNNLGYKAVPAEKMLYI